MTLAEAYYKYTEFVTVNGKSPDAVCIGAGVMADFNKEIVDRIVKRKEPLVPYTRISAGTRQPSTLFGVEILASSDPKEFRFVRRIENSKYLGPGIFVHKDQWFIFWQLDMEHKIIGDTCVAWHSKEEK